MREDRRPDTPRRGTLRLAAWASILALCLAHALPGQFSTAGDDESLFSIPRSQDDIHTLKLANADLAEGRFEFAVERLHGLLKRGRQGLTKVDPTGYLGMRTAVIRTLREMSPEGQAAYEQLTTREAGQLLRTAFEGRDLQALDNLADRFPTALAGRRARLRLGDLRLEAGQADAAIQEYAALLAAMPLASPHRAEAERRLQIAQSILAGQQGSTRAGDDEFTQVASVGSSVGWRGYGGGRDNAAPMTFPSELGRKRLKFRLASPGYGAFKPLVLHATGGISGLYFNTGHMVIAYDPIAGKMRWEGPGPMVGTYGIEEYFDSLNQSMLLVPAVSEDVVVAALQVPNDARAQTFHQLDLTFKIPSRRLFAFDRHTGKRLWAHWDYQGGPVSKRYAAHNAPAPPLIVDDAVYAPTEHYTGAVSYYLSSYDLHTGVPRWRTLICSSQLEVNMFGNAKLEYAATPVAMHAGNLYGTTNLGLCYSTEARTGRVRWCRSYPVIPLPRTRLQGQRHRPVFFANNPVVVHNGMMVCTPLDSENIIAFDTETGEILWTLPYRNQAGHANNLRWMLGVLGDELILSGTGVVAVSLQKSRVPNVRQVRPPQYLGNGLGGSRIARGAVTEKYIIHPLTGGLQAFDRDGNAAPRQFGIDNPGNVLLVDGLVVSARADEVQVYLDQQFLLDQTREAIRKDPDNPNNYLKLATLIRSGDRPTDVTGSGGARALKLLQQGLEAARRAGLGRDSPVNQSLAGEVFKIYLLRAEQAIAAGSKSNAIALLTEARDAAHDADAWITAQLRILDLHANSLPSLLAELDRLAQTHGSVSFRFKDLGEIPVRAYALWRSIPCLTDPARAVERGQELLEHFPEVALGRETGRQFGQRTIHELIESAGRKVYRSVEDRAAAALQAAGSDADRLRDIDVDFPHSEAAAQARRLVLDKAVAAGDLQTAASIASRSPDSASPGMLRRLMVAADVARNTPLARAIGERLLRDHPDAISDYAPDGGKTMAAAVQLPALPGPTPIKLQLPVAQLGATISPDGRTRFEILNTEVVAGYPTTDRRPLYVASDRDRLLAFGLDAKGHQELFSAPADLSPYWSRNAETLRLCGIHLIVNEGQRVRALHFRTGQELWKHPAVENRQLRVLGVQNGIVQLSSTLDDNGDGGSLLGLDVFTGSQLYRHVFAGLQETLMPRAFDGDLWTLHNPAGTVRAEVHRIDGVTGRIVHRFPIPERRLAQLVPVDGNADRVSLRALLDTMLVDRHGVYLSTADARNSIQPVVVAFDRDGKQKWVWTSQSDRGTLKLRALHEAGLLILEVTSGSQVKSQLLLLDKERGTQKRRIELQGAPRILDGNPEPFAPDLLLLEENASSTSLIGFALVPDLPSFRHDTHQRQMFWRNAVVGDDFVAAPLLGPQGIRMEMLVLRLADRKSALPSGRKSIRLPDRGGGYQVVAHDQYTICQTPKGLLVFGDEETPK